MDIVIDAKTRSLGRRLQGTLDGCLNIVLALSGSYVWHLHLLARISPFPPTLRIAK